MTSAAPNLARLLAQATPGPWDERVVDPYEDAMSDPNRNLAALAPDAVSLLIDMAAEVARHQHGDHHHIVTAFTHEMAGTCQICERTALLARFAELDRRAAP